MADAWVLYYNMENGLVVAKYANSELNVLDDAKYKNFFK